MINMAADERVSLTGLSFFLEGVVITGSGRTESVETLMTSNWSAGGSLGSSLLNAESRICKDMQGYASTSH